MVFAFKHHEKNLLSNQLSAICFCDVSVFPFYDKNAVVSSVRSRTRTGGDSSLPLVISTSAEILYLV
jgi:hypothetical protein